MAVENYTLSASLRDSTENVSIDIFTYAKTYSALIQTDKSVYRPGDKVEFRVLLRDKKMRLIHLDEIEVEVRDYVGNSVYNNSKITESEIEGVYEGEFKIPESSVLGNMNMEVKVAGGTIDSKKVLVANQAAPRFIIAINTKPATRFSDKVLTVQADIKHVFGAEVNGAATMTATVSTTGKEWIGSTKSINNLSKEFITFDLLGDLKIPSDLKENVFVTLDLKFEDNATGVKQSKRHKTTICMVACHKIKIVKPKLKLGFPYSFQVAVTDMTTAKLETDETNKVFVKVSFAGQNCDADGKAIMSSSELSKESLLKAGSADFLVDIPLDTTTITITATYLQSRKSTKVVSYQSNLQEARLKLTMENERFDKSLKLFEIMNFTSSQTINRG